MITRRALLAATLGSAIDLRAQMASRGVTATPRGKAFRTPDLTELRRAQPGGGKTILAADERRLTPIRKSRSFIGVHRRSEMHFAHCNAIW
jgi:hypothetical protein